VIPYNAPATVEVKRHNINYITSKIEVYRNGKKGTEDKTKESRRKK